MKYLVILLSIFIISCGQAPGTIPSGAVGVSCADVYNDGDNSECSDNDIAFFQLIPAVHAATLLDAGDIKRSVLVNAIQEVTNNTGTDITGWVEMKFDAGCNGATEWIIMPKQAFTFIDGQTFSIQIGGQCGDMPLGARTLTATAWQPDGITEIGQVVVSFNLIK